MFQRKGILLLFFFLRGQKEKSNQKKKEAGPELPRLAASLTGGAVKSLRSDTAYSACKALRIRLRRHGASVTGEKTPRTVLIYFRTVSLTY